MKKKGILNRDLSNLIAFMGHGDFLAIVDSGFPVWNDFCIDLSIVSGKPVIVEVLAPIIEELEIEKVVLAEEIKRISPKYHEKLLKILPKGIEVEYVPHEKFKNMVNDEARGVVRTGEQTSYSSIILVGGVTYHGER
ncbi:MAG TPA: D-ribose pyranase [Pseudothermotoga sp.]